MAGSKKHSSDITIDILGFDTEDCYRDNNKHAKQIIVKSSAAKKEVKTQPSFNYPVFSPLPEQDDFSSLDYYVPLRYIWPSKAPNYEFLFYINSCRYFSDKEEATLIIQVYPDIKWELAFELKIDIEHSSHTNMPAGSIFARHQKKAREAGYARWLMNKQGKVPIEMGLGLTAKFHKYPPKNYR